MASPVRILQLAVTEETEDPNVTIIRNGDGSIEFVDVNGNKTVAHSNVEMTKLFAVLASAIDEEEA